MAACSSVENQSLAQYSSIEYAIATLEYSLSCGCAIPIPSFQTAFATIKLGLGVSQIIAGGAAFVALSIENRGHAPTPLQDRALVHVKHGFGNIAAASFEVIPFVGTVGILLRNKKSTADSSVSFEGESPKRKSDILLFKSAFMPYPKDLFFSTDG